MALDTGELSTMDATAQAELVQRKELTPLELVDAAIARIERVNPTLNAVIIPLYEDARAAAVSPDLPEGPFRGVPFLLKDIGAMQKGQPYYMGNRALRDADFRSPVDTPLGARFRAAGLITIGKTNLPEFGMQSTTQPLAFGASHNPWALDRSTSGSSGGSCAAVAAGLVPVAHANDGGGSIRLPAAWCGLVGLKPSRGRISDPLDTLIACELAVIALSATSRPCSMRFKARNLAIYFWRHRQREAIRLKSEPTREVTHRNVDPSFLWGHPS